VSKPRKVVIVGGGFGGLSAAQHSKSYLVDVTLVDRWSHSRIDYWFLFNGRSRTRYSVAALR